MRLLLPLVLASLMACGSTDDAPRYVQDTPLPLNQTPEAKGAHVGLTREQVRGKLGGPNRALFDVKYSATIRGPVEVFWDELEVGDSYESWSYFESGGVRHLYFLRASDVVDHEAFTPTGVVY